MNMESISINSENSELLENFSKILKKDKTTIVNEALEEYFVQEQKKLLEKNMADENSLTNLDFDEFWEGVEV